MSFYDHADGALALEDPEEKSVFAAMQRCKQLHRQQPQKITGRHIFTKDLMTWATGKKTGNPMYETPDFSRTVMKLHSKPWRQADLQKKELYEKEAAALRDEKRQRLADDLEDAHPIFLLFLK